MKVNLKPVKLYGLHFTFVDLDLLSRSAFSEHMTFGSKRITTGQSLVLLQSHKAACTMGHEELWFDIGQVEKMKRVKRSIRDNRHEHDLWYQNKRQQDPVKGVQDS